MREVVLDEGDQGLASRAVAEPRPLRVVDDGSEGPNLIPASMAEEAFARAGDLS